MDNIYLKVKLNISKESNFKQRRKSCEIKVSPEAI